MYHVLQLISILTLLIATVQIIMPLKLWYYILFQINTDKINVKRRNLLCLVKVNNWTKHNKLVTCRNDDELRVH